MDTENREAALDQIERALSEIELALGSADFMATRDRARLSGFERRYCGLSAT